jgi:hypothetical protein
LEYQFLASIIGYNVVTVNTRYGKKKLGDEDGYEIYKSKRENYKKQTHKQHRRRKRQTS